MATESGFVKGQSDNLPKIDSLSMFSFLGENPNFMGAEIRGIKAARSGRESYGDNAVQVKRDGHICTVEAKITPEHRVRKKAYHVVLKCDEPKETIISVEFENCAASLGATKCVLEWSPLYVLGRLSYSAYLVNLCVALYRPAIARYPIYVNDISILLGTLEDLSATYLMAFFLTLLFELPISELQKLLLPRKLENASKDIKEEKQF